MELTLDQALKNGCTQKEEMFYRTLQTILEAHPAHPDANYHMGLLAVDANKISEALSFFKTALEMNPRMGQFWLSYIDTLIKLDRITEAKFMFDQAKDQGAIGELFDQLEKQLSDSSVYPQALLPDKLDPIESLYIQDQQDQASPKILETLFDLTYSSVNPPKSAAPKNNVDGDVCDNLYPVDVESLRRLIESPIIAPLELMLPEAVMCPDVPTVFMSPATINRASVVVVVPIKNLGVFV